MTDSSSNAVYEPAARVFIGTSGFSYSPWKPLFYPKGLASRDWLAYYARHYNTVEINATFYRPFGQAIMARWHDVTPDGFRFTLKGPKLITHTRQLQAVEADLAAFMASLEPLRPKLALLLWQFPPGFQYNDSTISTLDQFLRLLPADSRSVLEFRHKSWFTPAVYALLNTRRVGFVISDSPQYPAADISTGGLVYVRFHGPGTLYRSPYSPEALADWATRLRNWLLPTAPRQPAAIEQLYCYFNNTMEGWALPNAVTLRNLID